MITSRGLYHVLVNLSSVAGGNIVNVPSHMWSWETVQFAVFLLILSLVPENFLLLMCRWILNSDSSGPLCSSRSSLCCFLLSDILPHKFLLPLLHLTLIIFFSIHHVTGLCLNSPFLCHSLKTTSRAVNQGSCRAHLLLSLLSRIVGFLPVVLCLKMYSFSMWVCVGGAGCWGWGYL